MDTTNTNTDEQAERETTEESAETPLSLEEQLAAAEAARDENEDRWKRSIADMENFRRRAQKEKAAEREYQLTSIVRAILPAMDNLQRAIDAANVSRNVEELIPGVEMVAKQLVDALAQNSVEPIESVGQPFDPNLHEAIQQIPSEEYEAMMVINELERGYRVNDRVVRPSKVIVSSGPPSATETKDDNETN